MPTNPEQNFPSLYVHFPFCESKCHYCDFYSLGRERTRPEDPLRFEEALEKEGALWANSLAPTLDTLFFGGGTPSMTPPSSMERALKPLRLRQRVAASTEWTMEANPSSIETGKMRAYHDLGINRISMGVQAMRDDLLTQLGRVHSSRAVHEALESVFSAGFTNVSVDLLCGVPGQGLEDLELAMEELTQFPITHLSCYLLTLPKHHRMHARLPDEDTQLGHLLFIDQWMRARGFEHYEISNFAKPGFQARHNLNYWKGASYLGLGPSAHSFDARSSVRWKNISSLHKYASTVAAGKQPIESEELLTGEQRELEKWMLALRLSEGFPQSWLVSSTHVQKAELLQDRGLLEPHPLHADRFRLTARGFALSDQVIGMLA